MSEYWEQRRVKEAKDQEERKNKLCMCCGNIIPNYRLKRCKTCGMKCMHEWSSLTLSERDRRKIKYGYMKK